MLKSQTVQLQCIISQFPGFYLLELNNTNDMSSKLIQESIWFPWDSLKTDKNTENIWTQTTIDVSSCEMSTRWLWRNITLRQWKTSFRYCIFLILDKNCFHSQLNFMSLMGNLPTIAFCYLVWMHYTKSGLAFCILEWTDLSGYKQFYLYCAQFNHVNICMNFNFKIKAHNLWLKDLETASVIVFNTRHFLNVCRWWISWKMTWEILFSSTMAPRGKLFFP